MVSVILPTYNHKDKIQRAINFVLGQSYQDFELIIVDTCSYDDINLIIENNFGNEPRISYIKNAASIGADPSRNIGTEHVKGTFIAFIDSDDEWLPE